MSLVQGDAWLLLAVAGKRQHAGNDGYDDDPESSYRWDSTVPNHAKLAKGDAVALWDSQRLLGASVIRSIDTFDSKKLVHSCPSCGSRSLAERQHLQPAYRCRMCLQVFDTPSTEVKSVTAYATNHAPDWIELDSVLSTSALRALCVSPKSQHSLRPLKWQAFKQAIAQEAMSFDLEALETKVEEIASGHKTATVRVRIGQGDFRRRLIEEYGAVCAFSGPTHIAALEAAHLYSYATEGKHHSEGGLLLRRDLHRLFDLGHIAVHPVTKVIDIDPLVSICGPYEALHGQVMYLTPSARQTKWLAKHWDQHRTSKGWDEE